MPFLPACVAGDMPNLPAFVACDMPYLPADEKFNLRAYEICRHVNSVGRSAKSAMAGEMLATLYFTALLSNW
jgi:hypothetical protein